ncbi:MAG: DUF6714 family protein [Luteolibacter sp.]|uniref:DUF6714 family protein n=1 Tax=Luteolibacter sp. TaxID=1962973 RepID=UPI003263C693
MTEPEKLTAAEGKVRGYDPATVCQLQAAEIARSEARALIPEIESAFDGVPRPRITLSVARGYDDEWNLSEERVAELNALDPEQTWQEVPDQAIEGSQEYFTFSDPCGWLFYLPAFMCHCLRKFPDRGWEAVRLACERRTHFDLLGVDQLRCVDRFLHLCSRHD